MALDQRHVGAPHLPRLDLLRQPAVGLVTARDDHQPGGVLVEAMDDPGPPRILAAAKQVPQHGRRASGRGAPEPHGRPGRRASRSPPATRRRARCAAGGSRRAGPPPIRSPCPAAPTDESTSPSAPKVIATSARLKAGHSGKSMKSVTASARTRSARLPSAPPANRPTESRQARPPRIDREPGEHQRQGDNRHREHESLPLADPERQPPVGGVSELDAEDEALPLADGERGDDDRLGHLVHEDDHAAGGKRQAPGGDRLAHLRRAQPRISPTTTLCMISSRMIARIGLRSSAKPPPPIGGRKRRKTFR